MPSDFEKAVLAYEQQRLGRFTRVTAHKSADDAITIPVATAPDSPESGLTTVATIGLSQHDNGLTNAARRPLRVELLATGRSEYEFLADGLANAALNVASGEDQARPGLVCPGVFGGYAPNVTTPHGLLWFPFPWGQRFEGMEQDGLSIEWLLVIAISQSEMDFIAANGPGYKGAGVEKLIDAFERERADVWDFTRPSVV